jgi:hypothetical protein
MIMLHWGLCCLAGAAFALAQSVRAAETPYPSSPVLGGWEINWSTLQRHAPGSDNWPMTWAADDHQYTTWGDGGGFGGSNSDGRMSLGVARVEGPARDFRGYNVWGGKATEAPVQFDGKSYGILSVGGVLYMWVVPQPMPHLRESRLAWSEDRGRSWKRSEWAFRFGDGITVPTFLNFGRDYGVARDDFVYTYAIRPAYGPGGSPDRRAHPRGFDVHRPGIIDLARVPKGRIHDRAAYEFFEGMDGDGKVRWRSEVTKKEPVFRDANGVGWNMSVSFNAGLKRYLLITEHGVTHQSRLGLFDAPEPWGPWTTVEYDDKWGEGRVPLTTFHWVLPTKWMSEDGLRFTLVFSGTEANDAFNTVEGKFVRR